MSDTHNTPGWPGNAELCGAGGPEAHAPLGEPEARAPFVEACVSGELDVDAHGQSSFFDPDRETEVHAHRLPHWQQGAVYYFVTWRLADSIPREKLQEWTREKDRWRLRHPEPWSHSLAAAYHARFSQREEEWLDQGTGSCVLRDPALADIVSNALLYFDGRRYHVDSFVVMPNHVHVVFRLANGERLEKVIHSWKSFSAHRIDEHLRRDGPLWQRDYWDRMLRGPGHLWKCREYVVKNPVKARLRNGEFVLYVADRE